MERNLENIIKLLKAKIKDDDEMIDWCLKKNDKDAARLFGSEVATYEEFLDILEDQERFNKSCKRFGIKEEE